MVQAILNRTTLLFAAVLLVATLLAGAFRSAPVQAQSTPCLRIGSSFSEKHSVDHLVEENIRFVLAALNICMDIVPGPPKRLTAELLRGEIDGELIRVKEYARAVDEAAILVNEPLAEATGYLVGRAGLDLAKAAVEDLSIGTLRGVRWHLAASNGARKIAVANDMEQLVDMLRNRRVDAILVGGFLRDEYPQLANLPAKVVYRTTLHFVLHRSHAASADAISAAIRNFKGRGCTFLAVAGGTACSESGDSDGNDSKDLAAKLDAVEGHGLLRVGLPN